MVERSRRTRDMNGNFNTRMILTTAVFAALLVGPASASVMDQPDAFERAAARAMATHPATPGALQSAVAQALVDELDPAIRTATAARTALKVDQAVAAANEAYDTYRDKTATAARKALGISGDS